MAEPSTTLEHFRDQGFGVCVFRLAGLRLGLDVRNVQEVLKPLAITRVPLSPETMDGLVNLRGQIILAFNLRQRLELESADSGNLLQVVCLHQGESISFLVDALEEVQEIGAGMLRPVPSNLPRRLREALLGVLDGDRGLLLILDPSRVLGWAANESEKVAANG
jgi:purine-binding chemotaxis protein CheW